jgi:hypothetical protein
MHCRAPKNMHNDGNTSYRYILKKPVQEFGCASKVAGKEREGWDNRGDFFLLALSKDQNFGREMGVAKKRDSRRVRTGTD